MIAVGDIVLFICHKRAGTAIIAELFLRYVAVAVYVNTDSQFPVFVNSVMCKICCESQRDLLMIAKRNSACPAGGICCLLKISVNLCVVSLS